MDYEKLRHYRNTHNPFAIRLGIELTELRHGYGKVVKTITAADLNPAQLPHGGIYFAMADTACGSAMMTHGYLAVTVDANYHFIRSAEVGDIICAEAHEIKHGNTLSFFDVQVKKADETLLGTGTFTFYQLDQKVDI